MPLCLTGQLQPSNRNAIAWHNAGILAYGSHNSVIFVDVITLKVFQILTKHYSPITQICWQHNSPLSGDYGTLVCASADSNGHIIVWDVLAGRQCTRFFNQNHSPLAMKFMDWDDCPRVYLLVLHSKTLLILWNITNGEQAWECRLGFNAVGFTVDQFNSKSVGFASNDSIIIYSDLSPKRPPVQIKTVQLSILNDEDSVLDLNYHRAYPNFMFVRSRSQILCVNTALGMTVCSVRLDPSNPPLALYPLSNRDAFFTVERSGVVSLYVAKLSMGAEGMTAELSYSSVCSSETHRSSSKSHALAAALCPVYENNFAVVFNTGKILFHELSIEGTEDLAYRIRSVRNQMKFGDDLVNDASKLGIRQYGQMHALSGNATLVRVRPMTAIRDASDQYAHLHLAAVGTTSGIIHLVDIFFCEVVLSFQVHSYPVKCLEWGGANVVISASSSTAALSSSTVRNDIFAIDIRTGQKKRIRQEADESPVELLRVSHHYCYLALSFRRDPLEIWDLKSMRLLRRMSKRCPVIVDMAWFGKTNKTENLVVRENLVVLDVDNHLYHVVVKGLHVRDGKEVNTEWKNSAALLRCVVWKDDMLVFGDSAGHLRIWDLQQKLCRQTANEQSSRGPIIRCTFTPLAGDRTLAVQHPDAIAVWDVDNLQLLQLLTFPGMSVVDVDMSGVTPVYLSSDGALRYATISNDLCGPVAESEIPPILNGTFRQRFLQWVVDPQLSTKPQKLDDEFAQPFIDEKKIERRLQNAYEFLGFTSIADLYSIMENRKSESGEQLPCRLWMFWRAEAHRRRLEMETRVLMSQCKSAVHLELVTERALVLGKKEWATFLLLNVAPSNATGASDRLSAFKACLFVADVQTEEARCLIKLTATNLIASNCVSDGIQLLYLIGQGPDACRYLASNGDWGRGFAYAKLQPKAECNEFVAKFLKHLNGAPTPSPGLIAPLNAFLGQWNDCADIVLSVGNPTLYENIRQLYGSAVVDPMNSSSSSDI